MPRRAVKIGLAMTVVLVGGVMRVLATSGSYELVLPWGLPTVQLPSVQHRDEGHTTLATSELPGLDGPARSAGLYQRRVLDQSDLTAREQRARQLAFRLSAAGVKHNGVLSDDAYRTRSDSAVPLAIVPLPSGRGQAVALLTTRCVVDPMYPMSAHGVDHWNASMSNYALVSNREGAREVFRLSPSAIPDRPELAMTCMCDSGHPHLTASPAMWPRFANDLGGGVSVRTTDLFAVQTIRATPRVPLAEVSLLDGAWNSTLGADLVVLYIPIDDPGSAALNPSLNLGVSNPLDYARSIVAGRTSVFGDTFRFSLVSNACMQVTTDVALANQRDAEMYKTIAIVAVAGTLVVLVGGGVALPSLASGLVSDAASMLTSGAGQAALTFAVHTIVRAANGESLRSAAWDEAGNLVLSLAHADGTVGRFAVAGLRRVGLSSSQAQHVVELVSAFMRRDGAQLAEMSTSRGDNIVSLMDPSTQTDFSAEALRRGLVRLAVDDIPQLRQHRRLVTAAQEALADPTTRNAPAIQDPAYQQAVVALSQ